MGDTPCPVSWGAIFVRRRVRCVRFPRWVFIGVVLLGILWAGGGIAVWRWLAVDLPSPEHLYRYTSAPSTRIYDRNGRLLYEILDPHKGAHTPVPLRAIPKACIQATLATEDASFYTNPGVDLWAILRALWINLRGGEVLSGGSTITQQLARNLLLAPEERSRVSLERKLREAILAWRLARTYSKDEILTIYLNETYYGNLAYGMEAAARTYFAKSVSELDLAECALLAGLPQSPSRYNPLENPGAARERQRVVLNLMVKHGFITAPEADLAAREDLAFAAVPFPIRAPHFVMFVWGQLERELGRGALYTQGLRVDTTLDLDVQETVQRIVRYRLAQLSARREGQPPRNVRNAAVVVLDVPTGHILAMVGSPDYFDPRIDGAVNAALAPRQPGSSIKPITYAVALDPQRPNPLTPATVLMDVRTAFVTREGDPYVPQNYDRRWRGPVRLRQALAASYNLVAVKVLDYVGIDAMTQLARAMGITTFDDAGRFGLALTLGGGEVRLLELTSAYAAFASGGYRVEPVAITRVENARGEVLKAIIPAARPRVLDERVAYLISDILSDDQARASTFGEGSPLRLSRPAAAKTGTTTDWRDNWTVGYTPDLVTGVWVGNADNEPMRHVSGITGAAPIWHDVMETLLKGRPVRWFDPPEGLVRMSVCADSGLPPAEATSAAVARTGASPHTVASSAVRHPAACPRLVEEWFIAGTPPTRRDDWHWWYRLDKRNGLLAGPQCPSQYVTYRRYTLYPAEAQEWARQQGIPRPPEHYSPLCPLPGTMPEAPPEAVVHATPHIALVMLSPDEGARYRLSSEIPSAAQRLMVHARPVDGVALRQVTLLVDGQPLATVTRPPYRAAWEMRPGRHTFAAQGTDVAGQTLHSNTVRVEVTE
ncbi:MAG: penicillin-binding protein [Ardenticatenia bacterium]|nr:MAG: penicillin-binding protein [Ardenticatenia bacterium]